MVHDPSALGLGLLSLSLPEEQQIHWLILRPEQKVDAGLYAFSLLGAMPHFSTRAAHESPAKM